MDTRELAKTLSDIGMMIVITTISGACIMAWIYVIRNWKYFTKRLNK